MKANPQQLIHAYKNAPWRVQLQLIGMFSLAVVVIALIAGLYLNVTARAATIGREIQDMEREILGLQHITADLENQLGLLTSIKTMERRAEDLGFQVINPAEILYVAVPGVCWASACLARPPAWAYNSFRLWFTPRIYSDLIRLDRRFHAG
ncbi:MAG: hypothetical protein HC806_04835 [Anaerolineae bacterium]|nr:hypothetical protein [Anaerolineae bacterium]